MGLLRIFRGMEIFSRLFSYEIFLDQENVAQLKQGEQKEYTLEQGTHTFQIKFKFLSSQIYKFDIQENQTILLEVKLSSVIEKIALVLIFTFLLYQVFYSSFLFSLEISIFCLASIIILFLYTLIFYRNKIIWIYRIEAQ